MNPTTVNAALWREMRQICYFKRNAQRKHDHATTPDWRRYWSHELDIRGSQLLTVIRIRCALNHPGAHADHIHRPLR